MVWGLLGFLGLVSLYKHKRITLGKKMVRFYLFYTMIWTVHLHTRHYLMKLEVISFVCHSPTDIHGVNNFSMTVYPRGGTLSNWAPGWSQPILTSPYNAICIFNQRPPSAHILQKFPLSNVINTIELMENRAISLN